MESFEDLNTLLGDFGLNDPPPPASVTTTTQQIETGDEEWETHEVEIDQRVARFLTESNAHGEDDNSDDDDDPQSDLNNLESIYDKGCGCLKNCYAQFSLQQITTNILNMRELDKNEKDLLLMGTLKKINGDMRCREGETKRVRYEYMFDGIKICQEAFLLVFDIGIGTLRGILRHLKKHGIQPRVHGNMGRKAHNAFSHEVVINVVLYLSNYANEEGLPQPAAPRGRGEEAPVYLPSSCTKQSIHQDYVKSCLESEKQYVGLSTFKDIWSKCLPNIKICSPKDDVCKTCEDHGQAIKLARTEVEKLKETSDYYNHVMQARKERYVYRNCVEKSTTMFKKLREREEAAGDTFSCNDIHYTFDFSQYVKLPHHSREKGQTFFIQTRKIHIFGFRVDGDKQHNFLIDEDESIGPGGQLVHGPDSVISMLDHALDNFGYGENDCSIHADNCFGQNKNRYVLGYLSWRTMTQRHSNIMYMMQIPGHTRCLIDAGFGTIKSRYRKTNCDTVEHIADVVSKSAHSNFPVLYRGGQSWSWRQRKTFISDRFKKVPNISTYHCFRFSSADPGAVYMKTSADDTMELRFIICKTHLVEMDRACKPDVFYTGGLSVGRARYLYRHVRPLVRLQYQDSLCPQPDEIQ